VILLARRLQAKGERPAVLLRGYGRAGTAPAVVADGARTLLGWRDGGDEAVLLAQALPGVPIMVGADRVATGTAAVAAFQPTILLLDDGFQHRRVHRDADLVLLDGTDPFGGGRMLPRGRLREPVDSLARARGLLVTRADQVEDREQLRHRLAALAPGCPIGWAAHRPSGLIDPATGDRLPVSGLRDRPVHLLSGIANPGAFEATARSAGAAIVGVSVYPDHHPFTRRDCEAAAAAAQRAGAACILTTTKDAVRLGERLPLPIPVFVLEVEIRLLEGAEELGRAVGVPLEDDGRG
jgi:tetraacyldisaccharide 4'-kinase